MNRQICTFILAFGLSVVSGSTSLMAEERYQIGNIPFDFQAGKARVSAGTYIAHQSWDQVLTLRSVATGHSIFVGHGGMKHGQTGQSKQVFHKCGRQYFLAEVWFSQDDFGHALTPSKHEKEIALNAKPEVVYFAMQ